MPSNRAIQYPDENSEGKTISADELQLKVGAEVLALVKATEVSIAKVLS